MERNGRKKAFFFSDRVEDKARHADSAERKSEMETEGGKVREK